MDLLSEFDIVPLISFSTHTEGGRVPGASLKLDVDWQGQPHIVVAMSTGGRGGGKQEKCSQD